ncbi:hypothetical protein E1H12_11420 [Geitlerinema sp. P-1104]|uniref:hypothetical protein n=1 Tax=Geitlerinema sp. P-1104 TaxID=2546230 RepID=UPI001476EDD9|nr:hypothetical protein [Geitlerinema sp. P-1104]NMG59107.1 hypothetical protein [Geitlerinema sp. P-1104]
MRSLRKPLILFGLTLLLTGVVGLGLQRDRPVTASEPLLSPSNPSDIALFDNLPDVDIDDLPIPDVSDILDGDPPLTTSLEDVNRDIPLLDGRDFGQPQPLADLPWERDRGYIAPPGFYQATLESYCLHAGTHGPGEGNGYGYATLDGPRGEIVRKILREAVNYPEFERRDLQMLLWGILAQTRLNDMDDNLQAIAQEMLTDSEISEINGGALGLIPDSARRELFANLPSQVRDVLNAKAEIREQLSQANAVYEELENIAVLTGTVPEGEGSREIPQDRWSLHPDGYFVRYSPSGYPRTQVDILVPRPVRVVRDDRHRITAIDYQDGYGVQTEYDDEIGAIPVPGEPDLEIYRFSTIRLISPDDTLEVRDRGWTFVGTPSTGNADFSQWSHQEVASLNILAQQGSDIDWQEAQERYNGARETQERLETMRNRMDEEPNAEDVEDLRNYNHYQEGADTVFEQDRNAQGEWLGEHLQKVREGFAHAICELRNLGNAEACGDPEPDPDPDPDPERDPNFNPRPNPPTTPVNPGGDGAVPGNTRRQRLGISGRIAN